jgi:hypothetical protein
MIAKENRHYSAELVRDHRIGGETGTHWLPCEFGIFGGFRGS